MRWLITLLFCCLLSACFTAGKRGGDSPLAIYDFGTAPASLLATPRKQPLALEVRAPLWFDSQGIDYRLAYVDAARLREYARARWAGPPAQMIQQRLIQQLDYAISGQGQARCVVRVEITEFSQLFVSPEGSKGVLQGRVVLLDQSRRQVAALDLRIEKAASSQDARGGVAALSAAVEQLAADLLAWEKALNAGGNAGVCSS
ncbi:ABC-type transport auxiliary lipoprotein family protein [Ferribacterium limneticum]|uniref:ABC-type transport auxiliary lipoprotein family protein n=1 Tax=Ferribacterium limneticum TaxID=76259 RepID=UPI001CF801C3|nr:ABC-type transport auxiliary lipoprotein family protein [Ferribacterium limneticum]UCV24191.1 membrane integrity-associated transporter subunit PqiC [Ferribacterium limneticum]